MTESNLPVLWQPSPFDDGTDLLPVDLGGNVDRTGRDHVQSGDLILPVLALLQGMSDAVTQRVPGAQPGLFYHTGAGEVIDGPIRVLLCAHTRSRALLPKPERKEHEGLVQCIARDAMTGSHYGDCDACPHKEWGPQNQSPPCSESHNFTVLTSYGPAILRFSRTSYKAARNFITTWMMSPKTLWTHPAIVSVKQQTKVLPNGKQATFFSLDMKWQQRETVPPAAQAAARAIHEQVMAAYESGRFGAEHEDNDAE